MSSRLMHRLAALVLGVALPLGVLASPVQATPIGGHRDGVTLIVQTQAELDAALRDHTLEAQGISWISLQPSTEDLLVGAVPASPVWLFTTSTQAVPEHSVLVTADTNLFAIGTARVWAFNEAQVIAADHTRVRAFGAAGVIAHDAATVSVKDTAHVIAWDDVRVSATDHAEVIVSENVRVKARDHVTVTGTGHGVRIWTRDQADVTGEPGTVRPLPNHLRGVTWEELDAAW